MLYNSVKQIFKSKSNLALTKVASDIKKKEELELQQLIDANIQFITIIAHDLTGPLKNVLAFLSLLQKDLENGQREQNKQYVSLASESAKRAIDLLDELTLWSIKQNSGEIFNPKKLNLLNVLQEEIKDFYRLARQKRIEARYVIDRDLTVNADSDMLKTIVRNLIGNAVKFTPEGGQILVLAEQTENELSLIVRDTGAGISEQNQKNILSTDATYSTKGTNLEEGTGVGLKICKNFVDLHKGRIQITSTLNKGSEFKVILPIE